MFNKNKLLNMKKLYLKCDNQVPTDCIIGINKVFPNLKNLTLILSNDDNSDANHFDDDSKMKLFKNICTEISKLINLKYLNICSTDLINLENEIVCKEIFSLIKQLDSLNTIEFQLYDLKDENIMELLIELAKSQPKKWFIFPSFIRWKTTKFTNEDIPRNLSIRISDSSENLEIIH